MIRTTLTLAASLLACADPLALTAHAQDAGAPAAMEPATSPEATMPPPMPMDSSAAPAEPMTTPPVEPVIVQANPRGSDAPAVAQPNPESASAPVPPALPANPSYRAAPYKGALTAPPAEAMNKVYPVCTRTRTDSCRNPSGV